MTFPTLKVEIAFASDPLDDTPTWVDVSAYVRDSPGVQITRGGGGDPQSPDNAGRASFTLSCRDRRFDPTYAAGPYYGNLRARKQVRITATWSAVDYPMFTGFVTGFPVTGGEMGMDYVVEVDCYDALGYLAGDRLSGDPLADYVLALSPDAWFRQVGGDWDDTQDTYALTPGVGAFTSQASLCNGSASPAWTANGSTYGQMAPKFTAAGTWTISFWIQTRAAGPISDEPGEPDACLMALRTNNVPIYDVQIPVSGAVRFQGTYVAGTYTIVESSIYVADNTPHHIVVSSSGSAIKIYVDGVLDTATVTTSTFGGHFDLELDLIGAASNPALQPDAVPLRALWSSSLQDVALFSSQLTDAQVLAIYNLSRGEVVEATATRVTRILDDIDWPAAWRNIATDTRGIVGELVYSGQQVLTALQQVERSEQGRLFAAKDGDLTLTGRYTYVEVTRSNTVQATLSDDGAGQGYKSLRYDTGIDDIANDITVRNNLNSSRSTDSSSKTTYGTTADTVDTNLSTLAQCRDMAAGLVYLRKDPAVRFDPLTIMPSDWPTTFGLELGDRIQIESTPMGVGSQTVQVALIESIRWDISAANGWYFTVAGRPVPANNFWLLGTSVLGTSTIPGF